MSYTNSHYTEMSGLIRLTDMKVFCVDHAVEVLFDGDENAFEEVDHGNDTSCVDLHGDSYDVIHEGSIQYEQFPGEWYPHGLFCEHDGCGAEIVAANEEE